MRCCSAPGQGDDPGQRLGVDPDACGWAAPGRARGIHRVEVLGCLHERLHQVVTTGGVVLAHHVGRVGQLDEAGMPTELGHDLGNVRGRGPGVELPPQDEHRDGRRQKGLTHGGRHSVDGEGQTWQDVYASVFWSWASHSGVVNGKKVLAGRAAAALCQLVARTAGVAFMSYSWG